MFSLSFLLDQLIFPLFSTLRFLCRVFEKLNTVEIKFVRVPFALQVVVPSCLCSIYFLLFLPFLALFLLSFLPCAPEVKTRVTQSVAYIRMSYVVRVCILFRPSAVLVTVPPAPKMDGGYVFSLQDCKYI